MKANELRIGNLFIEELTGNIISVIEIKKHRIMFSGNFDGSWQAKPIPLTEEWLLKFGFKKDNNITYWIELNFTSDLQLTETDAFYPMIEQTGEFSHMKDNFVFLNSIKYVHQLQNLYFELTGKELKLKN